MVKEKPSVTLEILVDYELDSKGGTSEIEDEIEEAVTILNQLGSVRKALLSVSRPYTKDFA